MKVVIVGGVAAGMGCAARLRRLNENCEIIVFEKGDYVSFANCGLPYHISGKIKKRERLILNTPESFKKRFNIIVKTNNEAVEILREEKKVRVRDLKTNKIYDESYDKLVLTPGARARYIKIQGLDEKESLFLKEIPDMDKIIELSKKGSRFTIIGAGFIGLELAENLRELKKDVVIIEAAPYVLPQADSDICGIVHNELKKEGVDCRLNTTVKEGKKEEGKINLILSNGESLKTDALITCAGVVPETALAENCGLKTTKFGIVVDEKMLTDDIDIYAAGDAVETLNPVLDIKWNIALAGPANKQARVIANNICGINDLYEGTIGTSVFKIFSLTVAMCGPSSALCARAGVPFETVMVHPPSNASYYPESYDMTLKIIFNKENGKIYGAQCAGKKNIEKQIDVVSAYILNRKTVFDLGKFEHAYAPPYSGAKSPVNTAALAAENIIKGLIQKINAADIEKMREGAAFIIDVRTAREYEKGHIDGAVNIPVDDIRENLNIIPKDKPLILYCYVGYRSYIAARILIQNGFKKTYNLSGGYRGYRGTVVPNVPNLL